MTCVLFSAGRILHIILRSVLRQNNIRYIIYLSFTKSKNNCSPNKTRLLRYEVGWSLLKHIQHNMSAHYSSGYLNHARMIESGLQTIQNGFFLILLFAFFYYIFSSSVLFSVFFLCSFLPNRKLSEPTNICIPFGSTCLEPHIKMYLVSRPWIWPRNRNAERSHGSPLILKLLLRLWRLSF